MKVVSTCRVCKNEKTREVKVINPLEFLFCKGCGGNRWHGTVQSTTDKIYRLTPAARKILETLTGGRGATRPT